MFGVALFFYLLIVYSTYLLDKYKDYKNYRRLSQEINALFSEEKIKELHKIISPDEKDDPHDEHH